MMRSKLWVMVGLLVGVVVCRAEEGPAFRDSDTSVLSHSAYAVRDTVVVAKLCNLVLKKPEKELTAENLILSSPDDPDYKAGVHPRDIGYWCKPIRYTLRKNLCAKGAWFFLFLDKPVKPGKTYTISFDNLNFEALSLSTGKRDKDASATPPKLSFTWDNDITRSTAVHVNQAGYLPGEPKYAYLTQYAGWKNGQDGAALDVDFSDRVTFKLIDAATGKEAFEGKVALSSVCQKEGAVVKDRLSETRVWELCFTGFDQPGRYRVLVPGVGVSFPFAIGAKAYNHVLGTLMRGFYHQRCGTELTAEYTRFTHPACHLDDARVPAVEEYKSDEAEFYPQKPTTNHPCFHGHHDAGDYGKYTSNGSLVVFNLLFPFEVFPGKLQFDHSPLPNAGNGIPDLIDEAKWELDWLANMQDDDGLVFLLVKPDPTMSYEDSVAGRPTPKFNKQRSLWYKDLHVTASYAAALARAARTPEIVKNYPAESKIYLERARKAWDACMKHVDKDGEPNELVKGPNHSGSFLDAKDDYYWAAVELWLTTGEKPYHDYFLKHCKPKESAQWGWWPLYVQSGAAVRAYVFGKREGKDPAMLKDCTEAVIGAARAAADWQKGWATRCSFSEDPFRYGKWGWYYLSEIASYNLLTASVLVDEPERKRFIEAAIFNADQELGNSADDMSSITGTGYKRVVDHVHQLSRFDDIIEPIPGVPLGFHPAGYNMGSSARELMSSYTRGGMPVAYLYVDCWWVAQEFMCPQLADTAVVYAYLSDTAAQKAGKPSLTLTGNGKTKSVSGTAPFRVTLSAEAKGANGKKIAEYYWDLNNEEFACDRSFDYTFTIPGIYRVCCTVSDEDGWMSYEYFDVNVTQPAAELPNKGVPLAKDEQTAWLWHFDDGTRDSLAGKEITLTGGAKISGRNLMWMTKPEGKSVECSSPADGVAVTLDGNCFTDPKVGGIRVDALVNYEEDFPRGSDSSHLFQLNTDGWDCSLGVVRDTWNGRIAQGTDNEVLKKKITDLFSPRPGWHYISLGFDKATAKCVIQIDGKSVEFPLAQGKSGGKTTLKIGGFKGFIDEVRVQIKP